MIDRENPQEHIKKISFQAFFEPISRFFKQKSRSVFRSSMKEPETRRKAEDLHRLEQQKPRNPSKTLDRFRFFDRNLEKAEKLKTCSFLRKSKRRNEKSSFFTRSNERFFVK
ncbi:hypothetical protein AAC387_Pa10g0750 [Persea americana]